MSFEKRVQEQQTRLRTMGWSLLSLAALCSSITYYLPYDETNYWLSSTGKQGFYVLSLFFIFLGLYCLGALWRRRHFI